MINKINLKIETIKKNDTKKFLVVSFEISI